MAGVSGRAAPAVSGVRRPCRSRGRPCPLDEIVAFAAADVEAVPLRAVQDEVDLGHYLSQIAAAVMNTCAVEGIRLDQKTDYAPVSVNTALSVGLVVNELLTNSFKYAFRGRDRGVITVECVRHSEDR